jgi:hypothetical protein
MDSLFDEDIDEVGSEIEAFCPGPRCKTDTHHTIVSMYEDEVRRVQCSVCSDVHPYRKPRGEAVEETAESSSRRVARKPTWEEAMGQVTDQELARCRPYSIRDTYKEYDVVAHPTFDVGFVTELLPDNKVEVTFKDERRVLVHNRADLAAKMPGIADLPAPRPERKRKKRKKVKGVIEVIEQPPTPSDENALAQAKAAKREAVERAAEAKRRLTTQLAAERIKALRGSTDVDSKQSSSAARRARASKAAAKVETIAESSKAVAGKRARAATAAGGAPGKATTAKVTTASKAAAATAKAKLAEVARSAAHAAQAVKRSGARAGRATGAVLKAGAKKTVLMPAPIKLGAKKKATAKTAAKPATRTAARATRPARKPASPSAAPSRGATRAKTGPASKAKAAAPAAKKARTRRR